MEMILVWTIVIIFAATFVTDWRVLQAHKRSIDMHHRSLLEMVNVLKDRIAVEKTLQTGLEGQALILKSLCKAIETRILNREEHTIQ